MNKKKVIDEIRVFILMLLVISSLRSALADWNDVPTGSMKPTIQEGDRVVVNKLAYDLKVPFTTIELWKWDNPKRGDIVVLFSPVDGIRLVRSEEHTSELQSLRHLVCRLLLEKKKLSLRDYTSYKEGVSKDTSLPRGCAYS